MPKPRTIVSKTAMFAAFLSLSAIASASGYDDQGHRGKKAGEKDNAHSVQLGPRPYYLT